MVTQRHGVRVRLLVVVAVVAAGVSWLLLKLLQSGGRSLPEASWLGLVIFVALGLALYVAGRPVKGLVAGTATRPVNPLYAARVLAMAQAAALAGAAILGWYLAQVVLVLPDRDIPSQQLRMVELGLLGLGAAGLSAVGLVVQRWCRLDDEDGPGSVDELEPR